MNPTPSNAIENPQVRRIGRNDGDLLSLLGTVTRLKISSRETLQTFFIGEATLPPNAFVPLHYHPDVEVFLVLKGTLEVMHVSAGKTEFLPLASGEMALIPFNAVHGFRNNSAGDVHVVVIGGPGIEAFLVEAGSTSRAPGEARGPNPADFERMLEIAKRHGQVFVGDR